MWVFKLGRLKNYMLTKFMSNSKIHNSAMYAKIYRRYRQNVMEQQKVQWCKCVVFLLGLISCDYQCCIRELFLYCKQSGSNIIRQYCSTSYFRNGVNQMWILKYSKDLTNNLHSSDFNNVHSIRSYNFSTLYTVMYYNSTQST